MRACAREKELKNYQKLCQEAFLNVSFRLPFMLILRSSLLIIINEWMLCMNGRINYPEGRKKVKITSEMKFLSSCFILFFVAFCTQV